MVEFEIAANQVSAKRHPVDAPEASSRRTRQLLECVLMNVRICAAVPYRDSGRRSGSQYGSWWNAEPLADEQQCGTTVSSMLTSGLGEREQKKEPVSEKMRK